ncbi:MAG: glycosyltransferase family 4 protein [Pseudomonadota bacterium]
MRQAWLAVPGDLESPTGGYAYARALLAEEGAGWHLRHLPLPGGFPDADDALLADSRRLLQALPPDQPVLIDGLAYACLPPALLSAIQPPCLALVHHPLALETGLSPERAAALRTSEVAALALADGVVVTSPETARVLAADYAVPQNAITVAEPGTRLPPSPATGGAERPELLCVATISPRKGQETLVAALASLTDLDWHCRLVGSTEREPASTRTLRQAIADAGLQQRITLTGALPADQVAACYAAADLFVLPSRYEGYGMAFAEALSWGLPVLACPTGAVPQTVPADAALFVPPDDPTSLAVALRRVLTEPNLRQQKATAAWAAGRRLPQWSDTAALVAAALDRAVEKKGKRA